MISKIYRKLDKRYGKKGYLFTYRRYKLFLNLFAPLVYAFSKRKKWDEQSNTVISFTSFPARIKKVRLVIESLLRQTVMPKAIVLYLSKAQFASEEVLPKRLKKLEAKGYLTIKMVEGDLRSHKKYYYAMTEYPDCNVITVDDDIFYPEDFVEGLVKTQGEFAGAVCCNNGVIMQFDEKGFLPYRTWTTEQVRVNEPERALLPVGCGGVLYPKDCLQKEILLQEEVFMTLCPAADDLWLKSVALLSGTKAVRSAQYRNFVFIDLLIRGNSRLCDSNVTEDKNDVQMKNIVEKYPEILEILKAAV